MVVDIVQWLMTILIITMEAKVIVTLMIITCIRMMLLGVFSGSVKLLHHVLKIAGMAMTGYHVMKELMTILVTTIYLSRRCQATMVIQSTLMWMTPLPTRGKSKKG